MTSSGGYLHKECTSVYFLLKALKGKLKAKICVDKASDVKRGQNSEAEVRTMRPRPRPSLRGRGHI